MRERYLFGWLCILLCGAGPCSWASAQASPKPSAEERAAPQAVDEAKQRASVHFQRGVSLFQEGAFRAALVEFERANETAPDYRLLYNIGQAQMQVQEYLSATRSFERYLVEGGTRVAAERRNEVEAALRALRERVARLSIHVNVPDAEVFVDDARVGIAPLTSTISVNVGRHRVLARSADGTVGEQLVDVAGGDLRDVTIELLPQQRPRASAEAAQPTSHPMSGMRRGAIASWSLGGAAAVTAVVLGVMAQGKVDDLDKELAIKPPAGEPNRSDVQSLRDDADRLALATDVMTGVAIAGVVTGVVLWLVDKPHKTDARADARSARTVSVSVGLGSARVVGHF